MMDEDIVAVSPSTLYRILKEYNLIRQRAKKKKETSGIPIRA